MKIFKGIAAVAVTLCSIIALAACGEDQPQPVERPKLGEGLYLYEDLGFKVTAGAEEYLFEFRFTIDNELEARETVATTEFYLAGQKIGEQTAALSVPKGRSTLTLKFTAPVSQPKADDIVLKSLAPTNEKAVP